MRTLSSYTSLPITSNYGAATKLQLLVPGETAVDGSSTGKSGTPGTWTANTLNQVTVRVVDQYFNCTNAVNTTVKLSATDPFYAPPANAATSGGVAQIFTSLYTATTTGWQITASTATGDNFAAICVNLRQSCSSRGQQPAGSPAGRKPCAGLAHGENRHA